ncbi:MAG TPA: Ig-like domain-containing protein [Acidisarcina sp.]
MYRYLTLIALFLLTLPIGLSVVGCGTPATAYCANAGFGKKVTDVNSIVLPPEFTGISLSYGQTAPIQAPQAYDCNSNKIDSTFTYGSDNKALADLSPSAQICAGTWNRNSGGGIADFTICNPPASSGTAHLTAQGGGATSNPVTIYVHPPVTSASLSIGNSCVSQNHTSQLDLTAYVGGSTTQPFCSPYGNATNGFNGCTNNPANGVPDCICNLGHVSFNPQTPAVVGIDQFGVATAALPGTTVISANISAVNLNTGYFATCAPQNITLSAPAAPAGPSGIIPVTGTAPVPLTVTATDTQGNPLTGLVLTFTTTNQQAIPLSGKGSGSTSVSTTFPGIAQISALCLPPGCNPSPINKIGQFGGTGLPVASNTLTFQSPGNSSTLLWLASPYSSYFSHFDLSTSTASSPVKMPYIPNSMVIDPLGGSLYFGNYRELMIYNANANSLTKEDTSVPGVVLAVSPLGTTLVICDQVRQLIFLYSPSSGITSTIGGVATRASYSSDNSTVYITGPNALYVHSDATGWSTYTIPTAQKAPASCPLDNSGLDPYCSPDLSVANPAVGAFLSGTSTTARSYCYNNASIPPYYPATSDVDPATDDLNATADGRHVIGASAIPSTLTDIFTTLPTGACPDAASNTTLQFTTGFAQLPLPVTPTAINQVVTSTDSSLAFVTYSGTTTPGAVLPAYKVSAAGPSAGTITAVPLTGAATAPLAGIFSPNNLQFFVGTAGDDLVHVIDVKSLTDSSTINPSLPDANGNPVPAYFFAVRPRGIS